MPIADNIRVNHNPAAPREPQLGDEAFESAIAKEPRRLSTKGRIEKAYNALMDSVCAMKTDDGQEYWDDVCRRLARIHSEGH